MQQYTIVTGSHGRVLTSLDSSGEATGSMRVCTDQQIATMSAGSFKLYRRKIMVWRTPVHEHGTPEAIRTIDFLAAACRRRTNSTPAC